jgi:hypothetical protein
VNRALHSVQPHTITRSVGDQAPETEGSASGQVRLDRVSGCSRRPHLAPDANEASLTLGELLPTPRIEARIERLQGISHGRPVGVLHIDLATTIEDS